MIIREYELHSIKGEGKSHTVREIEHLSNDTDAKLPNRSNIVQDYAICYLQKREIEHLSGQYKIKVDDLIDNYSLKISMSDDSLVYLKLDCISYTNQEQSRIQDRPSINLKFNIWVYNNYFNKLNNRIKTITLECTKNIRQLDTISLIPLESTRKKYLIPSNHLINQILRGTLISSTVLNISLKLRDGLIKVFNLQNPFSLYGDKHSDKPDVGRIGKLTKIKILHNSESTLIPSLAKCEFKLNFNIINLIVEGPDGSGKRRLLNQLVKYFNLPQIKINLYELSKNIDKLNSLNYLFNAVKDFSTKKICACTSVGMGGWASQLSSQAWSPRILVVLDNLEYLFPSGCDSKLVTIYLELMRSLYTYGSRYVIVGTTTNIHKVDKATLNTFLIKVNFDFFFKFSNKMRNIESINWSNIGGLEDVKAGLKECITCIYARPEALKRLNIAPTKGILLYGPPGGGKTLLAKAVATEFSAKFIPLSIPNLIQHEIGESEKTLAKIFDKAKLFGPSVIFIDEIECVFATRNSEGHSTNGLISQLALEFDNLKYSPGVIVLAATNYPSGIDRSLLRPGRFDKLYYIPLPDIEERKAILLTGFGRKIISGNVDLQSIAHETEHFSGADLRRLVDRATLYAYQRAKNIRREGESVKLRLKKEDFEEALKVVEPTIKSLDIDRLKAFLE